MISAQRIIRSIFYNDTVNAARYMNNILSPLFTKLTEDKRLYVVFQQDSATGHMVYISLEAVQEVSDDHIISHGPQTPLI
jgi:hypothetical protein